jgi:phage-related protein
MSFKEEMEKLGKEIIGSHDGRVESIEQLKKETEQTLKSSRDWLKNFQDVHKKMSLEQRENLSKYQENLEGDVKKMLKGFRLSLEKMGSNLRKDLVKGTEKRKAEVSKTLDDTQKMMDEFKNSRIQMSEELKENLTKGVEKRKAEVSKTLEDTQKMMDDFKVSHGQMSKELKENLGKSYQGIKNEVNNMLNDFRSIQNSLRADLQKASLSWQETASILQEKRSGVKPIPKVAEKKIVKKEQPKPEQKIIKVDLNDKQQTLALIKERPEGIKLSEIGAVLGKDWRWYIVTVKELMEENKIRKEENLYYPMI